MKLRISILLAATDVATSAIQIVNAAGDTKGFLDADNANAVIDVGDDHVIYIGPRPGANANASAPAVIVSGGGVLDTLKPGAVAAMPEGVGANPETVNDSAEVAIAKLQAQLAEANAQLAAKTSGVVGAVDTGLTEVAKIEGEAKVIAADVAGFFPGASQSGLTP